MRSIHPHKCVDNVDSVALTCDGIPRWCEWWGWELNLFLAGLLCAGADAGSANPGGATCVELGVFLGCQIQGGSRFSMI